MKCSTRRLLSVMLCLAMVLAVLPVYAFADGTTTVYCQAPDDWTQCYVHYWGSGATTWPGEPMSKDENGIWFYQVPTAAEGIVINNGNLEAMSQSADQQVPTDENVMYVFNGEYWAPYGKVVEYYVAGDEALCGVYWNPRTPENKMVENADGTYSLTYTGVAAGNYEFKVTAGSWTKCWGEAGTDGNYKLTVEDSDSTVVISFDPVTTLISVAINPVSTGTLIAQETVSAATAEDAANVSAYEFIPAENGNVTVDITACTPGFILEVYKNGTLTAEYIGSAAEKISVAVTGGVAYKFWLAPYSEEDYEPVAGSVTFRMTADVAAGELAPEGGEYPGDGAGSTQENPRIITKDDGCHIKPGQTVWFLYDSLDPEAASRILHISSSVLYSVTYRGEDVPVDAERFVSYEMMNDEAQQGKYLFSVTNNGSVEAYFGIRINERPAYVVSKVPLSLGDNVVVTDTQYANTLYEFTPTEVGVYTFTISEGVLGEWGTVHNPIDLTADKSNKLEWTCTSVGQSILVGVAKTNQATVTVAKTGEYDPGEEIPETFYEYTFNFEYQLPADPELVTIDVLDDKRDEAILGKDGFFRYGSKNGPLLVADLNEFPINLSEAIELGQLRAYISDSTGKVTAKYNYNDAMLAYLEAGLVPVTQELAMMLSQLGKHHGWWKAGGFVFEETAPADEASAWMVACSYIKGSELEEENDTDTPVKPGTSTGGNPKTSDVSIAWTAIAMVVAGTCLIVLKKKENFFLS